MTETRRRALKIIEENPGLYPAEFARRMWPDSPGHRRVTKCGHGSTTGGGMRLAAGGYLGKLRRAGLVRLGYPGIGYDGRPGNFLTEAGRRALED